MVTMDNTHISTIIRKLKAMSKRLPTNPASSEEMVILPSGASYPKRIEPLTSQELALLETYATIKSYEKEAARIKAEEAKRRLEEADERYRAKVREMGGTNEDEDEGADGDQKPKRQQPEDDEDDDNSAKSEEDEETKRKRLQREREISQLRRDVAAAREAKDQKETERLVKREKEEALRKELLGEQQMGSTKRRRGSDDEGSEDEDRGFTEDEPAFTGPSIKKKRVNESSWDDFKPQPSLIANIGGSATPPHDFSKKMGMSKASLDGTILFPKDSGIEPWQPPSRPQNFLDGCLELELSDFDPASLAESYTTGNNTLAIKFHVPDESARFSINIAQPKNDDYNNILFHFNPRHFQRGGQLVINDRKDTIWGNDISVPLSTLPLMFGKTSCTLVVQINEEGFDVFVEGKHCARLEHRTDFNQNNLWGNMQKGSLFLQFPSSDDYGNPENWRVYRVWWGRKASMAGDLNGVAGVNLYSAIHPKKLFISQLSKLHSDPEVDLRRAELERAFRKYGEKGIISVIVPKDSTFAFIECATEQLADLAVKEMANKYRVNKARRTKHEALMEERAAKEAGEKGGKKEGSDWD